MNKTLLSTALVAVVAAIGFAPTAQAAITAPGGTINITGKVLGSTCAVSVNNGTAVVLPTIMTSDLATAGTASTSSTDFDVKLTGCDKNTGTATMVFGGGNINAGNGNLDNAAVGGSNVQIQLLEGTSLIDTSSNANAPIITVAANGTGSATLKARYYANTAAATAGLVSSSVNFTLTYP